MHILEKEKGNSLTAEVSRSATVQRFEQTATGEPHRPINLSKGTQAHREFLRCKLKQ